MESLACLACLAIFAANRTETTPDASAGVYRVEQFEALVSRTGYSGQVESVRTGKSRSLDLSMKDDQLLAQQRIFCNQIGTAAGQV